MEDPRRIVTYERLEALSLLLLVLCPPLISRTTLMKNIALDRPVVVSYLDCHLASATLALPVRRVLLDHRPRHLMPQLLQAIRYLPYLLPHPLSRFSAPATLAALRA